MRRLVPGTVAAVLVATLAQPARSAERLIQANALFDGRALLTIDGQARVLKVGQSSPDGVRLVSANAHEAVIELDGERRTLTLSRQIGGGFVALERREVPVLRNAHGQYRVGGLINGRSVVLLVDTGANVMALSSVEATRLGIDYRRHGTPTRVMTAGGARAAWDIMLDRVELSGIVVRNVPASVLEGQHPSPALLGMSFLSRVGLREEAGVLYLQER